MITDKFQHMKQQIITSAKKNILFLPHAIKQISRPDRMITADEIRETVILGEIIEEYSEDQRGGKLFGFSYDATSRNTCCVYPKT